MAKRTHVTWSEEHDSGKCPECGTKTVLIVAGAEWGVDEEDVSDGSDSVELYDEVTGHFCPKCRRLRSLSLNTTP